jgi:hypothetical protein
MCCVGQHGMERRRGNVCCGVLQHSQTLRQGSKKKKFSPLLFLFYLLPYLPLSALKYTKGILFEFF